MNTPIKQNLPFAWTLEITLLSDTAPGRGEGVAGLVDAEVDHDERGLPYVHGRRIKGLLGAQCAEILAALALQGKDTAVWRKAADNVFGLSGLNSDTAAQVSFGHARLPQQVYADLDGKSKYFSRMAVLDALTTIRRQTTVNSETGAAKDKSLRATRAIRKDLTFASDIVFMGAPDARAVGLLAACAASLHHIGLRRSRGMGWVRARLFSDEIANPLDIFEQEAR